LQEAVTVYTSEGYALFTAEKYDAALAAYRRTLEIPREAALAHFKGNEEQYQENRRTLETHAALCLARLGRLEEAAAIADRLAADAPKPDFTDPQRIRDGGEARWVRLEMARWLIDQKRLQEAEKLLAQVERDRPDWRLLDSRNLATRVSYGFRGWQVSVGNWQAWRYADLTWWRLRQAQSGLRVPPTDSP
jgi:tetratricopeptide (TPR) repeat protein